MGPEDGMSPLRVVIIGGGFAGTAVARDLDEHPDKVQVTLIDRRTVMLNTLGILRSSVNPEWVDKVIVPRNNLLTNGRVINENVSRVEEDRVIFEGGKEIEFDVVVCATGCRNWIEPDESKLTVQELRNHFETTRRDIESAESIAIVGGGAVGVEFAGEIKSRYPGKTVSVIHSSERLINSSLPNSFQQKLQSELKLVGVNYYLNDRALLDFKEFQNGPSLKTKEGYLSTASGEKVPAQLVFNCTGARTALDIYPQHWQAETGGLAVDPSLVIKGTKNAFAVGDVASIPGGEAKLAILATYFHAPVAAKNILALASKRSLPSHYTARNIKIFTVPVGPNNGVSQVRLTPCMSFIFGPWAAKRLKAQTLATRSAWWLNKNTPVSIDSKHPNSFTENAQKGFEALSITVLKTPLKSLAM